MYFKNKDRDNFNLLLKESSFFNLGLDKYNKNLSAIDCNKIEGTFSYVWYDNVAKENRFVVSTGLKNSVSINNNFLSNQKLLKLNKKVPLLYSHVNESGLKNIQDDLFKIYLRMGFLLKGKDNVMDSLLKLKHIQNDSIKDSNLNLKNIQNLNFNNLKFNVNHLYSAKAGLVVGLSGLKLFLPKGQRWMVYFPPNGYLRRICTGNLKISLLLMYFCLRFYKSLRYYSNKDIMDLVGNKKLVLQKLRWFLDFYKSYNRKFENSLNKSTLLKEFKSKYLTLNNVYYKIITNSLTLFIETIESDSFNKENITTFYKKQDSLYKSFLFMVYLNHSLKDFKLLESKSNNIKYLTLFQNDFEIDKDLLSYGSFNILDKILNSNESKVESQNNSLNLVDQILNFDNFNDLFTSVIINGNNCEKNDLILVLDTHLTKESFINFYKTFRNKELDININNNEPLLVNLNTLIKDINNSQDNLNNVLSKNNLINNLGDDIIFEFYENHINLENFFNKLITDKNKSSEEVRIINSDESLISAIVSRKFNVNVFNNKPKSDLDYI